MLVFDGTETTHEVERAMWYLRIEGRDNWPTSFLDKLEDAANGRIISHRDDSCGGMTFVIQCRPTTSSTIALRRDTLKLVNALILNSCPMRWFQS